MLQKYWHISKEKEMNALEIYSLFGITEWNTKNKRNRKTKTWHYTRNCV
jgi:hypothetical protein